ncbi:MAG TPA: hypothetical protein VNZ03_01235 [Terriglobales bacterium]|jgi:hypothetical protein|nr:hypothetical protein [Terriglobales bacterium]
MEPGRAASQVLVGALAASRQEEAKLQKQADMVRQQLDTVRAATQQGHGQLAPFSCNQDVPFSVFK